MAFNLTNSEEWYQQYNETQRKVQTQLDKWQQKALTSPNDRGQVRKVVKKAKDDVSDLKSNISILSISKKDKASRRDQCDELLGIIAKLEGKLKQKKSVQELLEKREEKYKHWKESDESSEIRDMDSRQILAYQNEYMKQQDESVDRVVSAIDRVKYIANGIGEELDEHAVLLTDLNNETIKTAKNIDRQNKKMNVLIKRASITLLLCIILFLFAVLVIVTLLVFKFVVL